ncbi:GRIM-19 protein [Lobosporangium transversale]|uniref:NADH dehydrogenase [ubiquinone] 1 alpha subcomplex subunit 13 n=1 Tax=Lobosporangium transversale TaxID=64571 RepID=A0A1Y2GF60_9FUNG|nr:GRIM-19 protein [Lobosporangium transversale]ORZ05940.1 GRIM-19 protein [Lobosporangium transversale]|eukprot:XP_021877321.1 GRIM-19 protein [Lobosporangium transversale]
MSTIPQQELPRPGGFPEIRYKRYIPKVGPSGLVLFSGITLMCTFGLYRTGQGNLERRELEREKVWSRIHLIPLLQAEADRDTYRREVAAKQREAEIMKNHKGWKAGESVYNSDRYAPKPYVVLP